jgi:hypothetical protein
VNWLNICYADKITGNIKNEETSSNYNNPIHYLHININHPPPPPPRSNMKLKYTTPKEIEKIVKSLKSKNSHGYNRIHTKILKISTPFITTSLTYIHTVCNKSLSSGIYSSRLKFSEIKPYIKKVKKWI